MLPLADQAPQTDCVFVVDDDDAVRDSVCLFLDAVGVHCRGFSSGEALLDAVEVSQPSYIILDLHMPGISGLKLLERFAATADAPPIIVLSGALDRDTRARASEFGAIALLEKPVSAAALLSAIRR
jgi:two-component system, LuxR family, response regulator FixJ